MDKYEQALIAKIEEFGNNNFLSKACVRNLQICFEELVINNIDAISEKNGLPITVDAGYSEAYDTTAVTISYGGEKYDPLTDGDELSAMLVKNLAQNVEYRYEDRNRITVFGNLRNN